MVGATVVVEDDVVGSTVVVVDDVVGTGVVVDDDVVGSTVVVGGLESSTQWKFQFNPVFKLENNSVPTLLYPGAHSRQLPARGSAAVQ